MDFRDKPGGLVKVRGLVKTAVARALSWSRADALIGMLSDTGTSPIVLGYHRVVEDFDAAARVAIPAMLTSRRMLEQQLDWIGQRYQFVSLDELGEELGRGRASGRPLAAVTFDDGYRDVYDEAFPVLVKKGIPAAVFVVTDLVGTGQVQIHDRLYMLMCRAFERRPDPGRALAESPRRPRDPAVRHQELRPLRAESADGRGITPAGPVAERRGSDCGGP